MKNNTHTSIDSSVSIIFVVSYFIFNEWLQGTITLFLDDFKWVFIGNNVLYYY